MILISACLAGVKCKYNGDDNLNELAVDLVKRGKAVLVCPEQLGGLTTPRCPAEIEMGSGNDVLLGKAKVITENGNNVTRAFIKGAEETLKIAELVKTKGAILKENSPSCGSTLIYDGSFKGRKKPGEGVTAALLKDRGYLVFSEASFDYEKFLREES